MHIEIYNDLYIYRFMSFICCHAWLPEDIILFQTPFPVGGFNPSEKY